MADKTNPKSQKPTLKKVVDTKLEETKLKVHAELVKNPQANKNLVDLKKINHNFKAAVVKTKKWAQDNHLSEKTQNYLNTLTDTAAVFLKELLK